MKKTATFLMMVSFMLLFALVMVASAKDHKKKAPQDVCGNEQPAQAEKAPLAEPSDVSKKGTVIEQQELLKKNEQKKGRYIPNPDPLNKGQEIIKIP